MSFFGNITAETNFNMGGGDFEPIPNKTQLVACVTEAEWRTWEADTYISLTWEVLDGEFKGRKVFQKIKVNEPDAKKKEKALRMLAAIDANAGGGLMRLGAEPNDQDLMINLCNKPMVIMVMVWEINDKKGNWVSMVAPKNGAVAQPQGEAKPNADIPF